jgi:hypothetical protein
MVFPLHLRGTHFCKFFLAAFFLLTTFSCRKDASVAPEIKWINPEKDVALINSGQLEANVLISDNNSNIEALISMSDETGNVFFSESKNSLRERSLKMEVNIPTAGLLPGNYKLSLLATDADDNRIRSSLNISFSDTNATVLSNGFVSLHQNASQAYVSFHMNGNSIHSVSNLADNAQFCADPTSGYVLMAPKGPGDARCFEPTEGLQIWSWPGISGTLSGFSCCNFTAPWFLLGEKSGYIKKFNSTGAAQGSCSYLPGSYYPVKVFVHDGNIFSVQRAISASNPDKIVVLNGTSGTGVQELNLPFGVADAIMQNDTLYLITESNPRQIWRYMGPFNSIELIDNTGISSNMAFLSPMSSSKFLLSADQGIYEVTPASNWTNLIFPVTGLQSAARLSQNPNHLVFIRNNVLTVVNKSTQNLVSELSLDGGAKDFLLLSR